ncbi:diguanylate cyclase domain-containing protein [Massilia endophytica]|uniref:diguanylate cyclase domain-containing protein n=1 Tax=Massilia endophytica TaxID=2899220 RepID=UPI001E35DA52|nr:diguanylate cyclase [Massilia endophytica]UGQ47992.1 diguanylate cyclase [Massilia endophytica]
MAVFSKKKLIQFQTAEALLSPKTHRVLVVDDEEANRKVMASILRPHFDVLEAKDGLEALSRIEALADTAGFSCIVSDQRMPGLTGVELFERLVAQMPAAVRIIVTGFTDVGAIVDSINRAQIYRFILKPFDANDFLLTVQRAVETVELQRQLAAHHEELEEKVAQRTQELAEQQQRLLEAYRKLEQSSRRILALYNNASCGYHTLDRSGTIVEINDTLLNWTGWDREALIGRRRFLDLVAEDSRNAFLERFPEAAESGWLFDFDQVEFELEGDEVRVPVLANATCHTEDEGLASEVRWTVINISERKQAEAQIRFMADHDALTGLPNRVLLQDRVQRDLLQAKRHNTRVAVIFIDIDHFKEVNDSLGHHCGDKLLVQIARRVESCLRQSDTLSRLGGDEFVVSLADVRDLDAIGAVAAKINAALASPFFADEKEMRVSGSLGIAIYPDDDANLESLMRKADKAMYEAKQAGRNCARFFSSD